MAGVAPSPGWKNPFLERLRTTNPSPSYSSSPGMTPSTTSGRDLVPSASYDEAYSRVGLQSDGRWVNPFLGRWTALGGTYVIPSNNPAKAVSNAEYRLRSAGYDVPPKPGPVANVLSTAIDALKWVDSKTGAPVRAFMREAFRNTDVLGKQSAEDWKRAWQAAVQTFKGEREPLSGYDTIVEMMNDPRSWNKYGQEKWEPKGLEKAVTFTAGFFFDVLSDPTTYIGIGRTKDVAKFLSRKYGDDFVRGLEAMLRERGILKEGEKLGQAAIQKFLTETRRSFQRALPGLQEQYKEAAAKVNRTLSGWFGKGTSEYIRKQEGGIEKFLTDLTENIRTRAKENIRPAGYLRLDYRDKVIDRIKETFNIDYATEIQLRKIARESPTEITTMDVLLDMFGDKISFSGLRRAATVLGKTKKSWKTYTKKGSLKDSFIDELRVVERTKEFFDTTFKNELDVVKAIENARAPYEQARRLEALIHEGDLWFRFGGVDLVNLTRVKQFTGRQIDRFLARHPSIRKFVDMLGDTFVTKFIKFEEGLRAKYTNPEQYSQLREMARTIYDFERAGRSTLGIAAQEAITGMDVRDIASTVGEDVIDAVLKSIDPEIQDILVNNNITDYDTLSSFLALGDLARNKRVMEAVPYFIESTKGDLELQRWLQIVTEKGLTPTEIELVKQAAIKGRLWTEIQKQIDIKLIAGTTDLSKIPEETLEYVNKLYKEADSYVLHLFKPASKEIKLKMPGGDVDLIPGKEGPRLFTESAELRMRTSPKHSSMYERKYRSIAAAERAGETPITNYAVLLAARQSYTRRAILADQLIRDLLSMDEIVSSSPQKILKHVTANVGEADVELIRAFEGADWANLGHIISKLQNKYAHPEVIRHLKNIANVFTTSEGMYYWMRWIASATNVIKRLQVSSLSFTLRNFIGEGFMAFIDGVKPNTVASAADALVRQTGEVVVNGRTFNVKQELTNFGKHGGWFAGVTKGNLAATTQDIIAREVGEASKRFRWPLSAANDFNDRLWRFAHYLEYRSRGYTVEDAVQRVRMFHVDYDDLTKAERQVFRVVAPFYTYMRKNLPIALRILMEQPGVYSATAHLVDNAFSAAGDPDVSEYLKETLAIPLYTFDNGDVLVLNWALPISDLARIKSPINLSALKYGGSLINQDALREILASLNPMITLPFQMASGVNVLTGRPIVGTGAGPADYARYVLGQLGTLGRSIADSQMLNEMLGVGIEAPINKPDQIGWTLQSVLPIQRPSAVRLSNEYRRRDQLQDYISFLRSQGNFVPTVDELSKPEVASALLLMNEREGQQVEPPPGWVNPFLRVLRSQSER